MKTSRWVVGWCRLAMGVLLTAEGLAQAVPKETPLFITLGKDNERMDERLFPIGWSADGRFAWLAQKVEEASDEGRWYLGVLDTKKNELVEDTEMNFKDKADDGVAKFWKAKAKEIQGILKKHGIKQGPMVMDHLPVVLGKRRNVVVAAEVVAVKREMEENGIGLGVESFTVNLRLREKQSVIFKKSYQHALPYAVSLAGCFYSPDQRYGVVVVTELSRGYEGPPHARNIEGMAGFETGVGEAEEPVEEAEKK